MRLAVVVSLLALVGCTRQNEPIVPATCCHAGCPLDPYCPPIEQPDLATPPDMTPDAPDLRYGGDAHLRFDPGIFDFGTAKARLDTRLFTVTVTNLDSQPNPIGDAAVYAGLNSDEVSVSGTTCRAKTLAPGGTCTITVAFTPVRAGKMSTSVGLTRGGNQLAGGTIVEGNATLGKPAFTFDPPILDFGDVPLHSTSGDLKLTIKNTGDAATTQLMVGAPTAPFNHGLNMNGWCPQALPVNQTCQVWLQLAPDRKGPIKGAVTVSSDGVATDAPLAGNGIDPAVLKLQQATPFVDQFIGDTGPDTRFTFVNSGSDPSGPLSVALSGANKDQFALASDGCSGKPLGGGATCALALHFIPTARGSQSAQLTVSGTPGGSAPTMLQARGKKHAVLSVNPGSITFSTTAESSAAQGFTILNDSDEDIQLLTATVNPSSGTSYFRLNNSNISCLNAPLLAGRSCASDVALNSLVQGTYPGTLTVSGAPATKAVVPLSGTYDFGGTLLSYVSKLDFGSYLAKPVKLSASVRNATNRAIGPLTTTIQGNYFSVSSDGCTGQILQPAYLCILEVTFTPTFTGNFSGTLTVAAGSDRVSWPLSADALVPAFQFSPAKLDFGAVGVGQSSAPLSATLHNISNRVQPTDNTPNNGDYTVVGSDCPASLAIDGTCTVSLRFGPRASGPSAGSLTFTGAEGSPSLPLSGTGQ